MKHLAINDPTIKHYCSFRLGHRLYGINLAEVREVSTGLTITPVAHAPSGVRGLANLRSRIYLVLDLRPLLGLETTACTAESRLIILKQSLAENVAVLVDNGGDIVSVPERAIEMAALPAAEREAGQAGKTEQTPAFVTEICKLEKNLMMVVGSTFLVDHVKRLMA